MAQVQRYSGWTPGRKIVADQFGPAEPEDPGPFAPFTLPELKWSFKDDARRLGKTFHQFTATIDFKVPNASEAFKMLFGELAKMEEKVQPETKKNYVYPREQTHKVYPTSVQVNQKRRSKYDRSRPPVIH